MLFKAVESLEPINSGGPVSISGNLLVTTFNEDVIVTDLGSGERVARLHGDGESITAIALAPDHSVVVGASRSMQIHIWTINPPRKIWTFPKAHNSFVQALEIDPTSTLVATGGTEGAVKVWDIRQRILINSLRGHGGPVSALKFYAELGKTDWRLASGAEDGHVRVWDLASGKAINSWHEHSNAVRGLAWTSRGDALLSGGRDKVIIIYRGKTVAATLPADAEVEAAGFAAGHIWSASSRSLSIWSLEGKVVGRWCSDMEDSDIVDVIRTADDTIVAILSDQTMVELNVNSESGAVTEKRLMSTNHGEIIDMVVLSPTELGIATNSHEVRIISLSRPLDFRRLSGHSDIVIALDSLGQWLASAGKDSEARMWDTKTGECKLVLRGHTASVGAVALSKVGSIPRFVLTGSADLTIKKWAANGEAEYTRKAHDKDINAIDVSRDDNWFATCSQDRTIKVWRVDTGEAVLLLKGHRRGVWSVRFAPENTLISGSGDKTVRQWSLTDGSALRTFEGHTSSVLKVLPFHSFLASAGGDGLIKIWNTRTSEADATLDGHEDKVWALASTADGQLISGAGDGVLRVWQDYTEEEQTRKDEEYEAQLELEQSLSTSVRNKDWDKALSLALELNRPLRLLKLFAEVADYSEPLSITGLSAVDVVIGNLEKSQILKLLKRVRDWNTTARTCATAQTVLHALLKKQPTERLWDSEVVELIEGILSYSRRHMTRTEDLLQQSYALDYALKEMTLHIQ